LCLANRQVASVQELQGGGVFSETWGLEGIKTVVDEGGTAAFCLPM
jgi:hypothetical protein